jgi:hypothetical protein
MNYSITAANIKRSTARLILCLLLVLGISGCDRDRTPAKSVFKEPAGRDTGSVKLILVQAGDSAPLSLEAFHSVTLTRYTQETQDGDATTQRWPGDTAGQVKRVVMWEQEVQLSDFPTGLLCLEPGVYRFRHNSVNGRPPSGFYGDSDFFEVRTGQTVEVIMILYAAI